jgi:hypothetical protein
MKKIICALAITILALGVAADTHKVLQIFQGGQVTHSFNIEDVEYMEITDAIDAPTGITAKYTSGSITVSWNGTEGATYNVYRSADGTSFALIAQGITTTTYTDTKPLTATNYYRVEAVIDDITSEPSEISEPIIPNSEALEEGLYLGIMGFNYDIYKYPLSKLDQNSISNANNFIDALAIDRQTLLYYSVDQAITTMQSCRLPDNLMNAAIVTFTDGLDMGSLMVDGVSYEEDEEYSAALNARIKNENIAGMPITAYTIGVKGKDVTDVNKFRSNLQMLASSPENAFEVSDISEVKAKFQEIAEQLVQTNYVQTLAIKIQGVSNGALVRFTLDNVASAERSECYIEGNFNLRDRSLENITYHGLTSTTGTTVNGVVDERREITFTFEGIQTDNNKLIVKDFIDEWIYISSSNQWQINSEFIKDQDSKVETEERSAAIMLVLDCSSSLGNDFSIVQSNAKSFVETLCPSVENPDNPDDPATQDPETLYSTKPIDLSLAVNINGKRYYLTSEQYANANLSGAVKEGLTVLQGDEQFIIALKSMPTSMTYWTYANTYYGSYLPTAAQAKIISARYNYISNAMSSFGAYFNYGWTSSKNTYYYAGGGVLGTTDVDGRFYIRPVLPVSAPSPIQWNPEEDLKLVVEKDGKRSYLSTEQYEAMGENLDDYNVIGIAVISGSEKFIIALKDEPTDAMIWDTAYSLYGTRLPTDPQGIVISMRYSSINSAIEAFGGRSLRYGWTQTSRYFYDGNGLLGSPSDSNSKFYVRCVYPFEDAQ